MKIPVREGVEFSQSVEVHELTWLSNAEAATQNGRLENHDYVDLRQCDLDDVQRMLQAERSIYAVLDNEPDLSSMDDLAEAIQQRLYDYVFEFADLDFGVGSTVLALSALGGIPVTSCNGGVVGGSHALTVPSVQCYLRKRHVGVVLKAAGETTVSVVSHHGRVELFTPDLRQFHRFASSLHRIVRHTASKTTPKPLPTSNEPRRIGHRAAPDSRP